MKGRIATTALAIGLLAATGTAEAAKKIRVIPVSFQVVNANNTKISCPVDNRTYTVRGHITGPRKALTAARSGRANATLYNHGHSFGEFLWRYNGVPGYNTARQMAKLGHISVTYDRLGYESSDKPNGHRSCYSSEADVTDQIIRQLKSGTYSANGRKPIDFERLALVGHSQAAIVNEGVASEFGNEDALVHISFSGANIAPPLAAKFARNLLDCQTGKEEHANLDPANERGYAFRGVGEQEFKDTNFFNTDPAVLSDVLKLQNPDPCGFPETVFPWTEHNRVMDRLIKVPVLLIFGADDPNFLPTAPQAAAGDFAGTDDKTLEVMPDTGHTMMLERTAPRFREILSTWLKERGY